jgi:hypothetical protein
VAGARWHGLGLGFGADVVFLVLQPRSKCMSSAPRARMSFLIRYGASLDRISILSRFGVRHFYFYFVRMAVEVWPTRGCNGKGALSSLFTGRYLWL